MSGTTMLREDVMVAQPKGEAGLHHFCGATLGLIAHGIGACHSPPGVYPRVPYPSQGGYRTDGRPRRLVFSNLLSDSGRAVVVCVTQPCPCRPLLA